MKVMLGLRVTKVSAMLNVSWVWVCFCGNELHSMAAHMMPLARRSSTIPLAQPCAVGYPILSGGASSVQWTERPPGGAVDRGPHEGRQGANAIAKHREAKNERLGICEAFAPQELLRNDNQVRILSQLRNGRHRDLAFGALRWTADDSKPQNCCLQYSSGTAIP
jgi:hypothetical protein